MRKVTVVIPGLGCEDLTVRCLDSLNAHAPDVVHEIIYVDNFSPAGTVEYIEAHGSMLPLRIVRNETNEGYPAACNRGIDLADKSTHVLLLNTDAFVGPQCVQRLRWRVENHHHKVAAVGPLTGDEGWQSLRREELREQARYLGNFEEDRYLCETAQKLNRVHLVCTWALSGFCILLNRDAIESLGLLRSDGAYASGLGADDEWCIRACKAGWKNLVLCNAWCVHLHASTFKRFGIDRAKLRSESVKQLKAEGVYEDG